MNLLSNNIIAEFRTKKAAEKFQMRVTHKTYIKKSDISFFGFKFKNVYQVILED